MHCARRAAVAFSSVEHYVSTRAPLEQHPHYSISGMLWTLTIHIHHTPENQMRSDRWLYRADIATRFFDVWNVGLCLPLPLTFFHLLLSSFFLFNRFYCFIYFMLLMFFLLFFHLPLISTPFSLNNFMPLEEIYTLIGDIESFIGSGPGWLASTIIFLKMLVYRSTFDL